MDVLNNKKVWALMGSSSVPSVTILMCTYNGAKFIADQLDSFEAQTHPNWRLVVSDDGSSDDTIAILKSYQRRWPTGRLSIREGPRLGYATNFLALVSSSTIKADFYAFSDQDDVWLPQKLAVAVAYLKAQELSIPCAYGGRTIYVDESLKEIGQSQRFTFKCSFRNAFMQSVIGGNTMVINHSAKLTIRRSGVIHAVSHDWWIYILVEGVGGRVYFDPDPYVLYRQHQGALVGANTGLRAMIVRFRMLLQGRFKSWNTQNARALLSIRDMLDPHNVDIVEEFLRMRDANIMARLRMINVCGFYRQGWQGSISLFLAAILKKI